MKTLNKDFELSEKSETFLENLRAYLFSSGKNEKEIDAIVEELKVHLYEAEQDGKPIEKIVGKSPKDYMKTVSDEMDVDYRSWSVYILLIVLGTIGINIMPDVLQGSLSLSVLKIVGTSVITILFIVFVFAVYRYISTNMLSSKKQLLVVAPVGVLPLALFIGLIYLDRAVVTPEIQFGVTGSVIIGIAITLFIIGMSIWARTWILVVVMGLLMLPDVLLGLFDLPKEVKLIAGTWITLGGMAIYMWIVNKQQKA